MCVKKIVGFVGLAVAAALGVSMAGCAMSQRAPLACDGVDELRGESFAGDFNVKDFGAKGDGVADDTAAITAAGKAAQAYDQANKGLGNAGEFDGPHAALVFPAGTYRLTDTVFFGRDAHLRGLGEAKIAMARNDKDIFYFHRGARVRVNDLTFVGGRHHLNLATLNHENANFHVQRCRFYHSSESAIFSISRKTDPKWQNVGGGESALGEFMPDKNGVFHRDARWDKAFPFNNSTFVMIEDNVFEGCAHATDFHSDGAVVRNCKIRQPAVAGAAIVNPSVVEFYGLDIEIERKEGLEQSFFEVVRTGGHFMVYDSTFRTSDGVGVPLFRSACTVGWSPSALTLRNCRVACGGSRDGAILRCSKSNIFPILTMDNVIDTTGKPARVASFEEPLTEESLKAANKRFSHIENDRMYNFTLGKLSPNISTDCGEAFKRHIKPYPKDIPAVNVARKTIRARTGKILKAVDFGVDMKKTTDDTAAMERFAAALANEPNAIGVLPPAWITLSRPITLKGDFSLVASGTAAFRHRDSKSGFFKIANGAKVTFRNIYWLDGKHAIEYREQTAQPTEIIVDNCFAFTTERSDQYDGAVFDIHADANPAAVSFALTGGSVYHAQLYRGNASAHLDGFWFRNWPCSDTEVGFKESTSIINEAGGKLRINALLGVPCTLYRRKWEAANDPKVPRGDFRWIDNSGSLYMQICRFGGEYGGLTPVYNFGQGSVFMEGPFAEFKAFSCKQTPIYCDHDGCDLRLFSTFYLSRPVPKEFAARLREESTVWIRQ